MKVFISHVRRDAKHAERIADSLGSKGVDVWLSGRNLLPGDNVHEKIAEALAGADAMVVVVSPAMAESEWTRAEVTYALGAERFDRRLIPIEVEATDRSAVRPWILRKQEWVDFSDEGLDSLAERLAERPPATTR